MEWQFHAKISETREVFSQFSLLSQEILRELFYESAVWISHLVSQKNAWGTKSHRAAKGGGKRGLAKK